MTRFMMTLNDAVELVLYAFECGEQGDLFVQKSPAVTIGILAQALKELFNSEFEMIETDEDRIAWMKDKFRKWKKEREESNRELIKKFPELKKHVPINNTIRQQMLKERLQKKWELT